MHVCSSSVYFAFALVSMSQIPCAQRNFLGMEPSGISPKSLRKGPCSRLAFMQSPKQWWPLPISASWSIRKGYLGSPPHDLKHERDIKRIFCASLRERNELAISYYSAMSSSAETCIADWRISSILYWCLSLLLCINNYCKSSIYN